MKFACPKCATRYSIADDKIPVGKTLRFTCKKCQHSLRLKNKAKEEPLGMGPEEMGAGATRVANLTEIMAVKRRSLGQGAAAAVSSAPTSERTPFETPDEWFVLVSGKQQGPLTPEKVGEMLRARKIHGRTYAWRDGMADWQRIQQVPEFQAIARAVEGDATAPRAPAPRPLSRQDVTAAMTKAQLEKALAKAKEPETVSSHEPPPHLQAVTDEAAVALARPTAELDDFFISGPEGGTTDPDLEASEGEERVPLQRGPVARGDSNADYLNAAPGEATRIFMATAGLYKRRRQHRVAAVVGVTVAVSLVSVIALDLAGIVTLPGMGKVYDMTGLEDPNAARAVERAEQRLAEADLTPEERQALEKRRAALRQKLMGGAEGREAGAQKLARRAKERGEPPADEVGIEEAKNVSQDEHDLAAAIMGDTRKQTAAPALEPPSEIQAPNLPEGLTQDSIFQVINNNQRSMSLCITKSMKAGEKLSGKMEVEMSIGANGQVRTASISTARFNGSTIGDCTIKTVKRWKFPRFNGEPVTVVFPYVLSASF